MAYANPTFNKRLTRLGRKHRRIIDAGAIHSVNHDGLIIARPRRRGLRLPIKGMFLIVAALIGFKVFLLTSLGEIAYAERHDLLAQGTMPERAGAYVMQLDRVTVWIAQELNKIRF